MILHDAGLAPPHAILTPVVVGDGTVIRAARWPYLPRRGFHSSPSGTVVVCAGRTEFIEKYWEVVADLRSRGFAAVVFDWRGQGLSARRARNRRKGHVGNFAEYDRDLGAVVQQVLAPLCPKPWFCLAHSMGAVVALRFAARARDVFERLVLTAPMVAIAGLPAAEVLPGLARLLVAAGCGRLSVPGRRSRHQAFDVFAGNLLTSDPERHARTVSLLRATPDLVLGAPTVGWLDAAFQAMAALHEDAFPRTFRTPSLIVMPGLDRVVEARAAERLATRLRACSLLGVPGCRHEILMERDCFRDQFWAAFDSFVPGGTPPTSASLAP